MHIRQMLLLCVLCLPLASCGRERNGIPQEKQVDSITRLDSTAATRDPADTFAASPSTSSSAEPKTPGWKTYIDDEYGFSLEYPPGLQVRKGFETVHLLSKSWRAMVTPDERGTAIISIPITRMQNKQSFPRYYAVDLRIGVSSGSAEDCAASNGERSIGAIKLNGVTFDQYEFSDAAMMQYVSGISYRTDHLGRCFAIEQIRNGSSYADQKSSRDTPQSVLDSCYYLAGKIVRTFKFVR